MFHLDTLLVDVPEALRSHLRAGVAADTDTDEPALPGLDAMQFMVRKGLGNQADVTKSPAVVFPDDSDPGVPLVRLTVDRCELPEESFDYGDTIRVKWRLYADVLGDAKTGSRTADISAATAEAKLASRLFRLLTARRAYEALEALGVEMMRPRVEALKSKDEVFRYPVLLTFETEVQV
jgi:hypothetical protein